MQVTPNTIVRPKTDANALLSAEAGESTKLTTSNEKEVSYRHRERAVLGVTRF
jgi:hypothetical protein